MAKTNTNPVEKIIEKGGYEKVVDRDVELLAAWYHADGEENADAYASKLRQAIKNHPQRDSFEVVRPAVERELIRASISGKGSQVVAENEMATLRQQFEYENSSGVERALIDRIVLCWLRLQKCEMSRTGYDKGTQFLDHIELSEKHLHMAHARYLRSIEELVKVRFLMSRTNPARLAAVRAALKGEDAPQQEPGKLLELKAG